MITARAYGTANLERYQILRDANGDEIDFAVICFVLVYFTSAVERRRIRRHGILRVPEYRSSIILDFLTIFRIPSYADRPTKINGNVEVNLISPN